jgi:hypothetical protein
MMSFPLTDTVTTAMRSASTNKTLFGVSFSWVQYKKGHDGSKLAQVYELDKLASEPFLTLCCVEAMKLTVISLHVYVTNRILLDCCNFCLVSLNRSSGVIRQSCDTMRFARLDSFF